jgi:phage shock protein PspC (stress-responsive transcriptional regulator)
MVGNGTDPQDGTVNDTAPPASDPSPSPTTEPSAPPKRLTRPRDDRVLGGVASGIARYFDIDPVFVRVAFVVASVLMGLGVLAYVAGWLLIPEDDAVPAQGRRADVRQVAGCIVLGIGLIIVLGRFGFWIDERYVWALALIVIGGVVLWLRGRDTRATPADVPPAPPAVPPAPELPEPPRAPAGRWSVPPLPSRGPRFSAPPPPPPPPGAPSSPWSAPRPLPSAPKKRRPPSKLGGLAICLVLVGTGVAIGFDAADVVDLSAVAVLGGIIAALGLALVVGGWWGRARWLIAPAVVLALCAACMNAIDVPLGGGIGERDYEPRTVAAIDDEYELGIGSLVLDLRRPDFTGRTVSTKATLGIGELKVLVPNDVRLVLDEHVEAGDINNFGDHDGGFGVDQTVVRRGVEGAGTLRLELRGGLGSIRVLDER